ncbi:hypothetical protein VCHA53O466_50288 [Vibrio chagasii]|nr:hypothetical protein VCHA53O466_50288 [Vibrio chagasii]
MPVKTKTLKLLIDELRYDLSECSTVEDAAFVIKRAASDAVSLNLSTDSDLPELVLEPVWGMSAETDAAISNAFPQHFENR